MVGETALPVNCCKIQFALFVRHCSRGRGRSDQISPKSLRSSCSSVFLLFPVATALPKSLFAKSPSPEGGWRSFLCLAPLPPSGAYVTRWDDSKSSPTASSPEEGSAPFPWRTLSACARLLVLLWPRMGLEWWLVP